MSVLWIDVNYVLFYKSLSLVSPQFMVTLFMVYYSLLLGNKLRSKPLFITTQEETNFRTSDIADESKRNVLIGLFV